MAELALRRAILCSTFLLHTVINCANALQPTHVAVAAAAAREQSLARKRHFEDSLLLVNKTSGALELIHRQPSAADPDAPVAVPIGNIIVKEASKAIKEFVAAFSANQTTAAPTSNPFVTVVAQTAQYTEVQIADVNNILSIYLLMFVPIAMAWVAIIHNGTVDQYYLIILPLTLCAMIVGLDLVNQSLSVLMKSPMALTSIQAFSMVVVTGTWAMADEIMQPKVNAKMLWPMARWSIVAILFTVYQVANHMVSYYCSLSERTVFLNLCPLVSLAFELTVFPSKASVQVSFNCRMALCGMAFGAVLFALQYPHFTFDGTLAALALVMLVIPYRLMQRWLLVDCLELPLAALACFDGMFLLAPTSLLTVLNQDEFWGSISTWFSSPAILLMLVLSWITFIGNHVCNLMLLRVTSATATLVFTNLANFVVVLEGVVFFGDKVVQNPLVLVGIVVSLSSGVWYAVEMQPRGTDKVPTMQRTESRDQGVGDCSVLSDTENNEAIKS